MLDLPVVMSILFQKHGWTRLYNHQVGSSLNSNAFAQPDFIFNRFRFWGLKITHAYYSRVVCLSNSMDPQSQTLAIVSRSGGKSWEVGSTGKLRFS